MLAKVLGPEMVRTGYSPAFAAVITSSAAIITSLIPPSIGLIIYAYIADVSVGRLFIGGIIPGLLLALSLMLMTWYVSKKRGYLPLRDHYAGNAVVWGAFKEAIWALSIPVFIIVGIRYGIFTPTEAGAMTVIYTIGVGLFVLGTAIEGTSALIILTPIFVPILLKLNVDPVHFGIVLVTNLTIAGITPPVGQMMFISSQVLHVPMEDYAIEVLPFLGAMLVVLLLLTVFPAITLWLPDLVYGVA